MKHHARVLAPFLLLLLASISGGCSRRSSPAPSITKVDEGPASTDAGRNVDAAEARAHLFELLRKHAVTHDDFARKTLYSWTTEEQVKALNENGVLLVADANTGDGPSGFNRELDALATAKTNGSEIATLLLGHPGLVKRRYAWPSPFATRMGLSTKTYGSFLLRVDLKDDAIVARFDRSLPDPWLFTDLKGHTIDKQKIIDDPSKLAAIYHVHTDKEISFREYVIVNESMIEEWSFGTETIQKEVDSEIAMLAELKSAHLKRETKGATAAHWKTLDAKDTNVLASWDACVAFDNDKYDPEDDDVDAMTDALGHCGAPTPTAPKIVKKPTLKFPTGVASVTNWCFTHNCNPQWV